MDAANIDLKGFTEDFYHKVCYAHLQPVLETLVYVKHETQVWLEITTLLIPGLNDSEAELEQMTQWVVENLGRTYRGTSPPSIRIGRCGTFRRRQARHYLVLARSR